MEPEYPLLYSVSGFRYCGLLLAAAERAAWRRMLNLPCILDLRPCQNPAAPSPSGPRRQSRLLIITTGSKASPLTISPWATPRSTRRFWNG
jgi:hypothetical protein